MSYTDTYITLPATNNFQGPLVRALQYTISSNIVDVHPFVIQDPNTPTQLAGVSAAGRLIVDGSGVTQPISGTVSVSDFPSALATDIYFLTNLSTTVKSVKSSGGNLYGWHIQNTNTVDVYVQIFNVASGAVVLGSTSPNMVLVIPAAATASASGILDDWLATPIGFGTAISIAATSTDTGSGAPSNALLVNFFYI
jgi:hypothetical protein